MNIIDIKKKPIVALTDNDKQQLEASGYSVGINANGNLIIIGRA